MIVTIAADDFLDECYGINYELDYDSLPIEGYKYVETNLPLDTPPEYLNDDDQLDYSYLDVDDKVQFKDITYAFEYINKDTGSKFYLNISNQDYWFNNYHNKAILIAKDTSILIERIPNVFQEKNIQQFFIKTLTDEILRIDSLGHFESFQEFFTLHRHLAENINQLWCNAILKCHEEIISKIREKIYYCEESDEIRTISEIIFMKSLVSQSNHLNKVAEVISKLSSNDFKALLQKFKSLIPAGPIDGAREINFYQYQNNSKEYKIVSSLTLFHLERLYSSITKGVDLKIIECQPKLFSIKTRESNVKFALNLNVFSKELLILVNATSSNQHVSFNLKEIEYICEVLRNGKSFNPGKNEIVKFNEWLNCESNRFLFQTFLDFASQPSEKIIPKGSYTKLARSIAEKFKHRGLSSHNLSLFLNKSEPHFLVTKKNKSLIAFKIQQIKEQHMKLKKGLIKKMFDKIIQSY
jgi:hypothetical protein